MSMISSKHPVELVCKSEHLSVYFSGSFGSSLGGEKFLCICISATSAHSWIALFHMYVYAIPMIFFISNRRGIAGNFRILSPFIRLLPHVTSVPSFFVK